MKEMPPFLPSREPEQLLGPLEPGQVRPEASPPRRIPTIHLVLFLATIITTILAGAMQQGVNPFQDPGLIYKGLPFSLTLLFILLTHEMGHYLVSRWHQLDVTLPYFIPAPPIPFMIGTLGAYIRIRSPIQDKPALLDVGAAGPLAGLCVTIPLLVIGLQLSQVQVSPPDLEQMGGIVLGESLLFKFISWSCLGTMPPHHDIILHPMAFAGWIGLLVTNLNLIPIGQLDGGHVSYALFGERSRGIAKIFYVILLLCGLIGWTGWFVWAILLYCMGFVHPTPLHFWVPLNPGRRLIGLITIAVFILTFMPEPFKIP